MPSPDLFPAPRSQAFLPAFYQFLADAVEAKGRIGVIAKVINKEA
jgi:hypothetical protein